MNLKREKIAKTLIIVGIFIFIISFIFSSDYHPKKGLKNNLDTMELVFYEGKMVMKEICLKIPDGYDPTKFTEHCSEYPTYPNSIKIAFKYIVVLSVILLFTGLIIINFGKKDLEEFLNKRSK